MKQPSSTPQPASSIIAGKSAKDKKLDALHLLVQCNDLSLRDIAAKTGLTKSTIQRLKNELKEKGVEFIPEDGRKRSGRKVLFEKAFARLEELKKQFPRLGGRELWVYLVDQEQLSLDEVPSVATINRYLSEKKLTSPLSRRHVPSGYWLTDKVETINDRVGMDEKFPFWTSNGRRFKIVDLRDWHSGAVYVEPFCMDFDRLDQRGVDQLMFARVYLAYCHYIGTPKVLVLDNGNNQITRDGWLPEIARHCIVQGTILDWEPPATPTQNSPVERWHREIEKRWLSHVENERVYKMDDAFEWMRLQALRECTVYPRHNLGWKPLANFYPIRHWDCAGNSGVPLPEAERIGKGNLPHEGFVRFHRRVESYGLINLHDADYIRVSDMLVGCKVRVNFLIKPGGEPGEGSVMDNHGVVVATFKHRLECGVKQGDRLIYDVKTYGYDGGEDSRIKNFSQEQYDEKLEKFQKNKRSKGFKQVMEQAAQGLLDEPEREQS